jgi:hypothetical protein
MGDMIRDGAVFGTSHGFSKNCSPFQVMRHHCKDFLKLGDTKSLFLGEPGDKIF